ncbi:MAG TPA: MFS transporter [Minicystis sp.]|nr:MFS transporter [Minicystis sp.]
MQLPRSLAALRHRDFRLYWTGQAVSLSGTWMQQMAIGWVVTDLSSDATVLGLLNVASAVPMLLLSLKGGELADRFEKRRILIATQVALMLLAFAYAALVYSGVIALVHVFALGVLFGVTAAFDLPAWQAMPPELVDRADIPNAVALMQSIFHGARLVGPALAGILIARFGRASAFAANGASFLAVIGTLVAIAPRAGSPRTAPGPRRGGMIREGLAYVRTEPAIRGLLSLTALVTGLVFPFLAVLMVYYVRYALGSDDARVLGIFMSASGLGSLVGSAAILSGSRATRRRWLVAGVVGVALGMTGLALATRLPFAVASSLVLSFSVSSLMGRASQMVQERVPGELRGRVMGIYSLSFTGIMPFSAMFWSWLVDRLGKGEGYRLAMQISAVLFVVAGLAVVLRAWAALGEDKVEASAIG